MQIQELTSKRMALELLLAYIIKDRPVKVDAEILDDIVNDLKTIKDLFWDMRWTRRLDSFGINPQLEELADSPDAHAKREKLDLELIQLSKEYLKEKPLDLGKLIESSTEAILNSNHPATHRSLAVLLDAFRETNQYHYGEIVLGAIRASRLPWTQQTIYAVLFFFEGTGDSQSFLRFVSFLCGGAAGENGLRKWFWTRVPGQRTVPCPPSDRYPGLVSRLITTSMATGQIDYAKAYLQKLLSDGYGLSPKLIWFLMHDFLNYRDWAGGREFLQQICEGHVPITPEVTTTQGLQRFVMACLQLLLRDRQETLYSEIIDIAVKHGLPPFKPSAFTTVKANWARILSDWELAYAQANPSSSPPTSLSTISTNAKAVDEEFPHAKPLFLSLSRALDFSPTAPGFVYHCAVPFEIRTGPNSPTNVVEKLIPGERSIWNWNRIRESVVEWGTRRGERMTPPPPTRRQQQQQQQTTTAAARPHAGVKEDERAPPESKTTTDIASATGTGTAAVRKDAEKGDDEDVETPLPRLRRIVLNDGGRVGKRDVGSRTTEVRRRGFRRTKLDALAATEEEEERGGAAVVGVGQT